MGECACRFFLCTIEVKWGNAQWIIKRPYGQFQAFDAWTNHYVLHLSFWRCQSSGH
jgi:hypothetical protein